VDFATQVVTIGNGDFQSAKASVCRIGSTVWNECRCSMKAKFQGNQVVHESAMVWPQRCDTQSLAESSAGVRLSEQRLERERRSWPRLPLAIPVFVRSRDDDGKEFLEFATALNISACGVLVAVRRSLPLSARLSLEIPSAPLAATAKLPKASRTLHARCVRITHAEGYHLIGLKFARPLLQGPHATRAPRRKVTSARVKKFSLAPASVEV